MRQLGFVVWTYQNLDVFMKIKSNLFKMILMMAALPHFGSVDEIDNESSHVNPRYIIISN